MLWTAAKGGAEVLSQGRAAREFKIQARGGRVTVLKKGPGLSEIQEFKSGTSRDSHVAIAGYSWLSRL